jgi:hypothetical protein
MSWLNVIKDLAQRANTYFNDEESTGEWIADFLYTAQTGHRRGALDNFSLTDLESLLDRFSEYSFFIIVVPTPIGELKYGILYNQRTKGGKWYVSTLDEHNKPESIALGEYVGSPPEINSGEDLIQRIIYGDYNECNERDERDECSEEDSPDGHLFQPQVLLLLRPTVTTHTSNIRKLIAAYEKKSQTHSELCSIPHSEAYVFDCILHQPEYLDEGLFAIIRKSFQQIFDHSSEREVSEICNKISVLFDKSYRAYRITLM